MSACAVSGGCGSCIDELFTVDWSEDCGGRAMNCSCEVIPENVVIHVEPFVRISKDC